MLNDLINEYDELIEKPSLGLAIDIGQKTYHALLRVIQQVNLHANPQIMANIIKLTQKVELLYKKDSNLICNYENLILLLNYIGRLYLLTKNLSEELKDGKFDKINLYLIIQGISLISTKLHEYRKDVSLNACKAFVARSFRPVEINFNKEIFKYFTKNQEIAIFKEIYPEEFNNIFNNHLKELFFLPRFSAEEENYRPLLNKLFLLSTGLEEEEKQEFYTSLYKFLEQPNLALELFLRAFPKIKSEMRPKLIHAKVLQLVNNFILGLKKGELGVVQNCLSFLSNPDYFDLIKNELILSKEFKPYLEMISSMSPEEYPEKGLVSIVQSNFAARLEQIKQNRDCDNPTFIEALQIVENVKDLSLGLRLLHLLETNFQRQNEAILRLVIALDKKDLFHLENILREVQLEPWDKWDSGDSLLDLAAQWTILDQISSQKIQAGNADLNKKTHSEMFFLSLISFTKKRWELSKITKPWQKVIDWIEAISFRSNSTLLFINQKIVFGAWDNAAEFYDKIFKIFLPADEHPIWQKFCLDPALEHPMIEDFRRDIYKGSQESYGHWFYLTCKACHEAVLENQSFEYILHLLAKCRQIVALMLANIQQSLTEIISFSTKTKVDQWMIHDQHEPFFFGLVRPFWTIHPHYLPLIPGQNYFNRCYYLFEKFIKRYSKDFINYKIFNTDYYYNEMRICFNRLRNRGDFVAKIENLVIIDNKSVVPTQIVWKCKKDISFFIEGKTPFSDYIEHFIIFHSSGENKKIIDQELSRLFKQLTDLQHKTYIFERALARFLYLFFQNHPLRRGSAAAGIILLNLIMIMHGRIAPDIPPFPYHLDLETMTLSEREFTELFIKWLNENK